ncbi:beta-defensin 126 [Diceros bicornis minor]|uniref:Beta-defensin n=1 Tax=Diceros bicornis minor TaxID=77932 RepID=A0A7J7EQ40_DICBM|nr:beta-defensin 126 [Diceros bicornis minor]KAF5917915.1 hypothetical protein HPG69_010068 [Diceros bicornis minor]
MKSLLLTLALFMLLVQLVSGNWYVRKCGNKIGNCRKKCRSGEVEIDPPTGMCSKEKMCCILSGKELNPAICGENAKATHAPGASGVGTSPAVSGEGTLEASTTGAEH